MPVPTAPREHAKAQIDRSIRKAIDRTYGKPKWRFVDFLGEVRGRSDLLKPARFRGRIDSGWLDSILGGLLTLTEYRREWLNPVTSWQPEGANPLAMFSSLAHHLLAAYPVPPVLVSSWFVDTCDGRLQRWWFRRAGAGISLRAIGLPIALTKRMAHEFAHAPAHYPVRYALRWAQVRGLGGSDRLARTLADTRLGREGRHDEFWVSLIHLLMNHARFDLTRVDSVVEFLYDQKCVDRRAIIGAATEVNIGPSDPDLSLKGWTPASLLRRVEEWQATRRPFEIKRTLIRWDRSSIAEFHHVDPSGQAWTIRELLDSDALAAEGEAMDHCVATYTNFCSKRLATIWSVATETPTTRDRAATVEVNPATREVIQTKAHSNESPTDACMTIIRQWATREALTWAD